MRLSLAHTVTSTCGGSLLMVAELVGTRAHRAVGRSLFMAARKSNKDPSSSVVERFLYTEDAGGSIPSSGTILKGEDV